MDGNGLAWVNPYRREVWDYLMKVAKQAAALGFDEIQFDYIRFPTEITDEEADYGEESLEKSKTDLITEFTAYAYETLSPLGVKVSADVFGTVIDRGDGRGYRGPGLPGHGRAPGLYLPDDLSVPL